MDAKQGEFNLITVHDDDEEELVVHAGSGASAAPAAGASFAPASATVTVEDEMTQAAPDAASEATSEAAPASADERKRTAKQEELLRHAEELERAEAGLEDPHAFSRTRIYVLVGLALLIVAFVVYTVAFMH